MNNAVNTIKTSWRFVSISVGGRICLLTFQKCSEKLEGVIENVDNEQMALKKENDKAETRVTWVSRAVAVMVAGIFVATGPTSVVAGTLAGSAVGLGVPYIHLKKGEIKGESAST